MSKELVDAIANGDNIGAQDAFNNSISGKVGDALEAKRKEISKGYVKTEVVEDDSVWSNSWIYSSREGWTS